VTPLQLYHLLLTTPGGVWPAIVRSRSGGPSRVVSSTFESMRKRKRIWALVCGIFTLGIVLVFVLRTSERGVFAVSVVGVAKDENGVAQVVFRISNHGPTAREWSFMSFRRDAKLPTMATVFGWMGDRPPLEPGQSEEITITLPAHEGRLVVRVSPSDWRRRFRNWPTRGFGRAIHLFTPARLKMWPYDLVFLDWQH
jgi:hypothetical protein